MADFIIINKYLNYQQGITIYPLLIGETRPLEFIKEIFASHIVEAYLKDGTFELFQSNEIKQEVHLGKIEVNFVTTPTQPAIEVQVEVPLVEDLPLDTQPIQYADATINTAQPQDGNEIGAQDDAQQTFEIMYKTTQQIQDKDENEIEVGTQLTQKELKEKGFTKKKLEALIAEEKVMEVKIIK